MNVVITHSIVTSMLNRYDRLYKYLIVLIEFLLHGNSTVRCTLCPICVVRVLQRGL